MRDIRPDLQERLKAIAADRVRLDDDERSIIQLLRSEEMRFGEPKQETLPLSGSANKKKAKHLVAEPSEKTKFILDVLADRQAWPLELLVEAAEEKHIEFNGKQPGRVLHFVLLGMRQRGLVEMTGRNEWRIASEGYRESDANGLEYETAASLHG